MAKRYSIFLGGNKRHYGPLDVAWESDLTPFDEHVEYAAHLKRRHFVLPYHWSYGDENHQMWFREQGIRDLAVGDELAVGLLAAGSKLYDYVFNNKMPVEGTKFEIEILGSASDSPLDMDAITAKLDEAKAALTEAQTALAAAQTPENLAAVTEKQEAVKTAEDEMYAALSQSVAKFEVDANKPGFHYFEVNKFLQTNGLVIVRLKEGTMVGSCWSSMLNLVHFDDQHGCACVNLPCETEYPEPECRPGVSSSKY